MNQKDYYTTKVYVEDPLEDVVGYLKEIGALSIPEGVIPKIAVIDGTVGNINPALDIAKKTEEKVVDESKKFEIKNILANHEKNAFTVVWADGTNTVIHLQEGDKWDDEKALAMCFVKKLMGNKGAFNYIFTEEMPAKLKTINKKEAPIKASGTLTCNISVSSATETAITTDTISNIKERVEKIENVQEGMASAGVSFMETLNKMLGEAMEKSYVLYLGDASSKRVCLGTYHTIRDLNKAMMTYQTSNFPWSLGTPKRFWEQNNEMYIDFGSSKYFVISGLTVKEYLNC